MEHSDVFSVPRRFDIATVLVAMTGLALIFTLVVFIGSAFRDVIGSPAAAILALSGLFVAVTFGQALVIKGGNPRLASIIAGWIYWVLVAVAQATRENTNSFDNALFITLAIVLGPVMGYLSGALVGGVFLIAFHLREGGVLAKHTRRHFESEESPWDVDDSVTFEIVEPQSNLN